MYRPYRLKQDIIDQAKSANLIDYMLIHHPDRVFTNYGIRDSEHDSLVLYPDSYCRYSTGEVQDSIHYLEYYQGYRWRDAVLELAAFAKGNHDKPGTPAFDTGFRKKTERFFRPVETNHIELITDYLHDERGISIDTIQNLIPTWVKISFVLPMKQWSFIPSAIYPLMDFQNSNTRKIRAISGGFLHWTLWVNPAC
ncbi:MULTISPECIES: hypothetical protein [Bacteria]|uniref:hypothetical protein n=1 Tax=Bacteroides acidifaciens TaxID=85831 RepID=UPI00080CA4DF|nr:MULTISPECIES: hypothetical protein [Bacteria]QQQ98760.1 hypothetical protein I5Q83_21885 [Enterocloster clostridioformis]